MKKSFLLIPMMAASCMQVQTTQFKPITPPKSMAVPAATTSPGLFPQSFVEDLKMELRRTGWKLVVSGVTGRAGENASINSGAKYTLLGGESDASANYSVVENKTGEEVMLIRGGWFLSPHNSAKKVAKKLNGM